MRISWSRLRSVFARRGSDATLDEELRAHLEMLADDYVRAGMSRAEASRRARLRLGGVEQTKEAVRDARATWVDSVWQDIRYALRTFRRAPGFTAVAVLTLALGIGVNSTIFSLADGVLFRPLPYQQPDRLVSIAGASRAERRASLSVAPADFLEWRRLNHTCDDIAAIGTLWIHRIARGDVWEEVRGMEVSTNFFALLGVFPVVGRPFSVRDLSADAPRVAIITYGLWLREFGGDPNAIGRDLQIPTKVKVVGVMPASFEFPTERKGVAPEILTPLVPRPDWTADYGSRWFKLVARLKTGVPLSAARADLDAVARRLMPAFSPRASVAFGPFDSVNMQPLAVVLTSTTRPTALALFLAATILLLIACVNLANLVLARGADRQRELAMRAALGAGRGRLVRQLLTESILLSLLGGAAALILSFWTLGLLRPLVPERLQLLKDLGVDPRLFAYTLLASLTASVMVGVAPALRLSGVDANLATQSLRRASRRRVHAALVFAEVMLALVVLAGGGLLINSYLRLTRLDPGYRPERVLTMRLLGGTASFRASFADLLDRLGRIPGVTSVGASDQPLLGRAMRGSSFEIVGREWHDSPAPAMHTQWGLFGPVMQPPGGGMNDVVVTPGYFETMGVRLLKGRPFSARDGLDVPPVAVISESLARRFGPNANPIGQHVRDGDDVREIVGVVADVRDLALDMRPNATVYLPFGKQPPSSMSIALRANCDPMTVAPAAIGVVRHLNRMWVISDVRTVDDLLGRSVSGQRFNTLLFTLFALAALTLCVAGIYGVVSYGVAQRTREIGVRVALGACPADVATMIVWQALVPVAAGVTMGLAGAAAATRLLRSMLFQVEPADPLTFGSVTVILFAAALVAAYLPARRATRIDPTTALRWE